MAGNDGDLLKQATQAMMSRYEGKILGCFLRRWAPKLRGIHKWVFRGCHFSGTITRSFAQIPFAKTVLVFSSASGCCFHDDVSRTRLNVKVDEGSYQCGNR
jgi:hypothetical protein